MELALSRFCAPGDVITRLLPDEEVIRKRIGGVPPQNFHARPSRDSAAWVFSNPTWHRNFLGDLSRMIGRKPGKFLHQHWKASAIRHMLPERIWYEYFKFTIIRNPYDVIVSHYHWENFGRKRYESGLPDYKDFDQWLRYRGEALNMNWTIYTENDEILPDYIIKYESIKSDVVEVDRRLGLGGQLVETLASLRAKGNVRPKKESLDEVLDIRHRRLIEIMCEKELEFGGYSFPELVA